MEVRTMRKIITLMVVLLCIAPVLAESGTFTYRLWDRYHEEFTYRFEGTDTTVETDDSAGSIRFLSNDFPFVVISPDSSSTPVLMDTDADCEPDTSVYPNQDFELTSRYLTGEPSGELAPEYTYLGFWLEGEMMLFRDEHCELYVLGPEDEIDGVDVSIISMSQHTPVQLDTDDNGVYDTTLERGESFFPDDADDDSDEYPEGMHEFSEWDRSENLATFEDLNEGLMRTAVATNDEGYLKYEGYSFRFAVINGHTSTPTLRIDVDNDGDLDEYVNLDERFTLEPRGTQCADTDGGKVYDDYGRVSRDSVFVGSDYCAAVRSGSPRDEGDWLAERYCDGGRVKTEWAQCDCDDGACVATEACIDTSDSIYHKGYATLDDTHYGPTMGAPPLNRDTCVPNEGSYEPTTASNWLAEAVCDDGKVDYEWVECTCSNGECQRESACYDTEQDYRTKGYAYDSYTIGSEDRRLDDKCVPAEGSSSFTPASRWLAEASCTRGLLAYEYVPCECVGGRCIDSTSGEFTLEDFPDAFMDGDVFEGPIVVGRDAPSRDILNAITIRTAVNEGTIRVGSAILDSSLRFDSRDVIAVGRPCDNTYVQDALTHVYGERDCDAWPIGAFVAHIDTGNHDAIIVTASHMSEVTRAAEALASLELTGQACMIGSSARCVDELPTMGESCNAQVEYESREEILLSTQTTRVTFGDYSATLRWDGSVLESYPEQYPVSIDGVDYRLTRAERKVTVNGVQYLATAVEAGRCGWVRVRFRPDAPAPPPFPDTNLVRIQLDQGWNLVTIPGELVRFVAGDSLIGYVWLGDEYVSIQDAAERLGSDLPRHLATHAFWVYAYGNQEMVVQVRAMSVTRVDVARGWNLLPIIAPFSGESIHSLDGDCRMGGVYLWDSSAQEWRSWDEHSPITGAMIGDGFLLRSGNACSLRGGELATSTADAGRAVSE